MQRLAGAIAGVLCVIVSSVPVAAAATTTEDAGGQPLLSVRTPLVEDDAAIIANASGLCPGQSAYFVLTGSNGSVIGPIVTVRPNGTARQTFAAGRTAVGDYTVWVKQRPFGEQTCHKTGVTVVRVVDDCSTDPNAVVVQQSAFRRQAFGGGPLLEEDPGGGIIDIIVDILTPPPPPDPETTTTTIDETTTNVEPTSTTEAPTTTAEPTSTTEAPTTTAEPTSTTEAPTTTAEPTTTIPAPTTTDAPTPPAFPSGPVACDPGPEAADPVPTTTLPGTAPDSGSGDGTAADPTAGGGTGPTTAPTGDDNPRTTDPSGGTAPGGSTDGTAADGAAAQDAGPAVVTESEPDGDPVDLAVTRYAEGPSKVKAAGFCTSSLVTFTMGGVVVGAVLAGPDGTAAFNVPASSLPDEPGVYEVIAVSNGNDDPLCDMSETTTYVVPAAVASSPPVVKTGSSAGQTGVSALGPLVVAGQLNRQVLEDAEMPITGTNPDRILRFAGGAVLVGFVLLVLVGIRRRFPAADSAIDVT